MDQDAWIERLDAHMERGDGIMASIDMTIKRMDITMKRGNEIMLRHEVAFRDLREFLADQTIALRGLTRTVDHIGRRSDRLAVRMDADHKEFVEEMRAQRRALFKVLDRLDGNGGPAGEGAA